jgi:hypothetical protein
MLSVPSRKSDVVTTSDGQSKQRCNDDKEAYDLLRLQQTKEMSMPGAVDKIAGQRHRVSHPVVRGHGRRQLEVTTCIKTLDDGRQFDVKTNLVDSGVTDEGVIDQEFIRQHGINTLKLPKPVPVLNADGTENAMGPLTEFVQLKMRIGVHEEEIDLMVAKLSTSDIYLGHGWLERHNPEIDWRRKTVTFSRCPEECRFTHSIRFAETSPDYVKEFPIVFSKDAFDHTPEHRPWDFTIELKEEAPEIHEKGYSLSPTERKAMKEWLDENLKGGKIRPSTSSYASPCFFVPKPDGGLRMVIDYRKLNEWTIKNRYPLPRIHDLMDHLTKAKIYSKLDVRWGFNNIRVRDEDVSKLAFTTPYGLFEPLVMQFGLANAPATFQNMMNDVLKEEMETGKVAVYVDDILIFTEELTEHREMVRRVLAKMAQHGLYAKPEKCEFEVASTTFLGMKISYGVIGMDKKKTAAIELWPTPLNKTELRQFLGLTNYYRRFIKGYGNIARPLHDLTGKGDWHWGPLEQEAFEGLKTAVTGAPVLGIPDDEKPFLVEVDASKVAVGGVLSQKDEDGNWRPLEFLSKALNKTEQRYEIYDRELLAILTALREWRQYLLGASTPTEIRTDHQNLIYFRKPQRLNPRQARWMTELQGYNVILKHVSGKSNTRADPLSRRPDHGQTEEQIEEVLLPSHLFRPMMTRRKAHNQKHNSQTPDVVSHTPDMSAPLFQKVLEAGRRAEVTEVKNGPTTHPEFWRTEEDTIFYQDQYYVPEKDKHGKHLREEVIHSYHDHPLAGHQGWKRTIELIQRDFNWPTLAEDVHKYIKGCNACQANKPNNRKRVAPLVPHAIPSRPWEVISWDLIGPLPKSQGYDAILVIADLYGKGIHVVPTNVELTAEGAARIMRDTFFRLHGLPKKVISDRGTQFVSGFMRELYHLLGIEGNPSTAYHPQTDGQTERMNQEVEKYLRMYVNYQQDDWADWLPLAEFTHNNAVSSSTGHSPFFLDHGYHPYTGKEPTHPTRNPRAKDFATRMWKIRTAAEKAMMKAKEVIKKAYDRRRVPSQTYKTGDQVWLEAKNVKTLRPTEKLASKRLGPFTILKKVGHAAYKLQLPATWRIHPVFHESLLLPYHSPEYEIQIKNLPDHPPPEVVGDHEEWEVEEILDSRYRRRKLEYLVKWKGYPSEENTWQTEEDVKNAKEAVESFHKRYPGHPRRLQTMPIFQPIGSEGRTI